MGRAHQRTRATFEPPPGRVLTVASRHTFAHPAMGIDLALGRWDTNRVHEFGLPGGRRIGDGSGDDEGRGPEDDVMTPVEGTCDPGMSWRTSATWVESPWCGGTTPRIGSDRAALVELANAPDVFRDHAEHALGRELVPGEIRPLELTDEQARPEVQSAG